MIKLYVYTTYKKLYRKNGAPEEIRTPDPLLRRQLLYPAELQALVGVVRFELTTTRSQSECATRLRYTPSVQILKFLVKISNLNRHNNLTMR